MRERAGELPAYPGVVVAGCVVGEGAHAVPNVVEPLRPCHCHHVTQHGRQVVPIHTGFPFF